VKRGVDKLPRTLLGLPTLLIHSTSRTASSTLLHQLASGGRAAKHALAAVGHFKNPSSDVDSYTSRSTNMREAIMSSDCEQVAMKRFTGETIVPAAPSGVEQGQTCCAKREIIAGTEPRLTRNTQPLLRFRLVTAAPTQLGPYRLLRRLGAGGMGEVYQAEHPLLKRPCAIKLIRPERAGEPRVLARFEREVRLISKLSHGNTVEIFDYGRTEDGTFFYVMEYLPGLNLEELLQRHGPLPAERVIHFLRQTCQALREAHSIGLIHRDIKPANLFAAQRGGVYDVLKLLDFGLVKEVAEMPSARLTQDGAITGTPLFMSPEQASGVSAVDARSDIYSLGAVAYALLTGHPPFERISPLEVLIAHARDEVIPPSQVGAAVPDDLEQIILRCLAKKSEDRYQDTASLEQALSQCATADQWTPARAARWWQTNGQDRESEAAQGAAGHSKHCAGNPPTDDSPACCSECLAVETRDMIGWGLTS
jgi:serine/threonine protein kinase